MPRQANGQYLPPANTTAITATTISSTAYNTLETDIGTEITNSVDRLGRSAMQAALPMGANKITGMADPTVATDAATKSYADTLVASFFSTGDAKMTLKASADTGWVLCDDGTIGSASSSASNRANADTQALFTLIFNIISDTYSPILTSGGGATTRVAQGSASAAWGANCRITLPRVLGRVLGICGTGSGLTGRTMGQYLGEETHTLTSAESAILAYATTIDPHQHSYQPANPANVTVQSGGGIAVGGIYPGPGNTGGTVATATTASNAAGGAHNNIQPTTFLNLMIKL